MAKYSSPTTRPTSPCRASRPNFRQKVPRLGDAVVLDVARRRVAVDHHGLILDERATSLVVPPDALRLRIGGRAAEDAAEHLERGIHPARLVDRGRSIPFDVWDEEDHEDALAPAAQDRLPHAGRSPVFLRHRNDQYRSSIGGAQAKTSSTTPWTEHPPWTLGRVGGQPEFPGAPHATRRRRHSRDRRVPGGGGVGR